MRHVKIGEGDLAILPALNEAEEGGQDRPPVAMKHFFFCGRMPPKSRVAKALPAHVEELVRRGSA